mmetsp:Transcript_16038/g.30893  ORF Transcript_16038/g.30893 Transcript_16038/m.30893 type:complete len:239 (+) Transcript_16038:263-979(+)
MLHVCVVLEAAACASYIKFSVWIFIMCFCKWSQVSERSKRTVWLADTFSCLGKDVVRTYMPILRASTTVLPWLWPLMPYFCKRRLVSLILRSEFPAEDLDKSTLDWIGKYSLDACPDTTNPDMTASRGSIEDVQEAFSRHGLLDENVKFLKGWFSDTLPKAPIKKLAILRLDGDFYKSTMDGLNNLYNKIVPGGFCIVDDYHAFVECERAVTEFRASHNITSKIIDIDDEGVYWRIPS